MPRYVVERTFTDGLPIPAQGEGAALCLAVVERNTDEGVTWIRFARERGRQEDVLRLATLRPRSFEEDRRV